jgi:hypothetical protein
MAAFVYDVKNYYLSIIYLRERIHVEQKSTQKLADFHLS